MRLSAVIAILVLCSAASAQVILQPKPPTGPGPGTNTPPQITVAYNSTQVTPGGVVQVAYNTSVSSPAFQITVSDTGSQSVSLQGAVSNAGSTGIVQSEWSSASAPTNYTITPNSGVFNAVAGTTHVVTLTANDGQSQDNFSFTIQQDPQPNSAPAIMVASNGNNVAFGSDLAVNHGESLASLSLQISITDQNNDNVSLSTTISNLGSTGVLETEFESTGTVAPFGLSPTTGVFNTLTGATHTISLVANDGQAQFAFNFNIVQVAAPAGATFHDGGYNINHNDAAAGTSRDFGIVDVSLMPTASIWIVVSNVGGQDLTVGSPSLTGNGAADFRFDLSQFNGTVSPGATTLIGIYYDAAMIGADAAWVEVTHNDASIANPFQFEVTGVATASNVPVITLASLPGGTENQPYTSVSLPVTGGTAPFTFAQVGGAMPAGMSIDAAGFASGTPTERGSFQFIVEVTDAVGASTTQQITLDISRDLEIIGGSGGGGGGCVAGEGSSMLGFLIALPLMAVLARRRHAKQ